MYLAIASTGAWLNLFNLLPVWQLDGNRGFSALTRTQRLSVAATFGAAWAMTSDGLLVLLLVVSLVRAFDRATPVIGDRGALAQFVSLVLALSVVFHFARV
jgi:Zn-dependent protease